MLEVNNSWKTALKLIESRYPHTLTLPRDDNFGIALYSKLPFSQVKALSLGDGAIPTIVANYQINGNPLTLVATHPLPPIGSRYLQRRDNQLAHIAAYLSDITHHKILVGDLNVSMWSDAYRQLETDAKLSNARQGFGLYPTWPAQWPLAIAAIPIDHVMISTQLRVKGFTTGPNIGSDHLPVIADIDIFK